MKTKKLKLITFVWLLPLLIGYGVLVILSLFLLPRSIRLKYLVPIGNWLQSHFYEEKLDMKYRIMKTDTGKYVAQVKKGWLWGWDDIFYAGIEGLVEYSQFKESYGRHNNRWSDTKEECEEIITEHKRMTEVEEGKNLRKI